jgi:hypothetical protein
MSEDNLKSIFARLSYSQYKITSDEDPDYNCIAWAAGDDEGWWWPDRDAYWPPGIPREDNIDTFIAAFQTLGYVLCRDGIYQEGFIKIAIFADADSIPTHAARQLSNGIWTSKCGELEDIEHDLNALGGPDPSYGNIVSFMKKPA